MSGPRVGVIGARRQHQGLGPFVARDLVRAGAEVPCFLATHADSLEPAQRGLADHGVKARGYLDLQEMLACERLDALAICSPAATHETYLWAALEAGLHVLCEKPLVWGGADLGRRAARIAGGFDDRGLLLRENCQWPYVLRAFESLYPGSLSAPARRFAMQLQPSSLGVQALGDAMPHALSLLQILVPGAAPVVSEVRFAGSDSQRGVLVVGFAYLTSANRAQARVELSRADAPPRRASLEVDGRRARRLVDPSTYRLSLTADGRTVPLADPLTLLVSDFVRELSAPDDGPASSCGREIAERMGLLGELVGIYQRRGEVEETRR